MLGQGPPEGRPFEVRLESNAVPGLAQQRQMGWRKIIGNQYVHWDNYIGNLISIRSIRRNGSAAPHNNWSPTVNAER